jgi:hypothetical protein
MITTEEGLTFKSERGHRRCQEHPELLMYSDGYFGIEGRTERHTSAANALATQAPPDGDP